MINSLLIYIFVQVADVKLFRFWFVKLAEQFQVHNLYKTCKSTKNPSSNIGIIEETMDLPCILLALCLHYIPTLHFQKNCSMFVYVILLFCKHVLGNCSIYGSNSMHPILWWHIDFINKYLQWFLLQSMFGNSFFFLLL